MPRRRSVALNDVVKLRTLQQQASELGLSRAITALEAKREGEGEARRLQTLSEQAWTQSLTGMFDPDRSRAWSSELIETTRQVKIAAASVARAQTDKEQATKVLQSAQARSEAVGVLLRAASRRDRRAAENRLSDEIADRFSGKGPHED